MRVALTGSTGFIGSHALTELLDHGHEVLALVRDDVQAEAVAKTGAAVAAGAPGAVPGSDDEARGRLGDYFADVLLLDQGTDATKARTELGWAPTRPSLVDEFAHGSYHG